MFTFAKEESPAAKCIVSRGVLPRYIDYGQLPTKKRPFSTIMGQPFSHTVDLVLPQWIYDIVWDQIKERIGAVRFSRVIMPLSALLEDQFFNSYIKSGNIAMLSEGRPGVDNVYSLKDGLLRLELPKEVYERAGLVGTPVRDGGRKHVKSRYAVEINLRLPSMVHGKKGFERIAWASKNALGGAVNWLFHDLSDEIDGHDKNGSPIAQHYPFVKIDHPVETRLEVLTPPIVLPTPGDFAEEQLEIVEWLGLVALDSPRVRSGDTIDPYLSSYKVPQLEQASVTQLVKLTWHGFISPEWVRNLYLQVMSFMKGPNVWYALSVNAFKTEAVDGIDGYTILTIPSDNPNKPDTEGRDAFATWEMTSCISA